MLSNSQRLRRKIKMASGGLDEAARKVWLHPNFRELYPEFLFTVHSITRATAPSMHAAAESSGKLIGQDPVAAHLHEYLAEHTVEETGHDLWTLDDLERLGVSRESVLSRIPSPAVAALVGSQYYWIHHFHPVAYIGYIAVLEGPQSLEFLDSVIQRTGLPREAFSTHLIHAKLDIHHVKAFDEFLDGLPLTEAHHEILGVNAIATVGLLQGVFEELYDRFERNSAASRVEAGELAYAD
jgi:hypothetical protein